jgi:Ca-activated chloride channel family protein
MDVGSAWRPGRLAMTAAALASSGALLASQPVFRSGVDLVHFTVTVADREGSPITNLTEESFEIYEEGRREPIRFFARGEADQVSAPPLHLGLLFDTSGSMSNDMRFARSAAIKFLNTIQQAVDITLVDFDTEVRVARYGPAEFPRLVERIRMREPEGWTALYDALGVYLDGAAEQEGRKILVLYTDGGDTRSSLSFGNLLDLLRASDVTVYAIGLLEHQPGSARQQQRSRLHRIAELTGGQAFFPLGADTLDSVYQRIVAEVNGQYSLGYASSDTRADGRWRRVQIKLVGEAARGVRVRTRSGYFAPYRK